MNETAYQRRLIRTLKARFPGCIVLKNDPKQIQGIPDLTLLYGPHWASLEVKESEAAPTRPNQRHYVEQMDDMSYAAFIYPENEERVLDELQLAFGITGDARLPQS